jgi:hypothetical protein
LELVYARNVDFQYQDTPYPLFLLILIVGAGGASNIFKPRSVGEGAGRVWDAPWSSGSAYALLIEAGLLRRRQGYASKLEWVYERNVDFQYQDTPYPLFLLILGTT